MFSLPKTENAQFSVAEMITVTAKLHEILREESNLLAEMKVRDIGALQEEKQKLSQQLESFQRLLTVDDSSVRTADPGMRQQLVEMTDAMMDTAEENLRRTVIAQGVNQRVMQTIIDAMAEQQRLGIYGSQGQANAESQAALSVNLNERA